MNHQFRHITLQDEKHRPKVGRNWVKRTAKSPAPDTKNLPGVYFVYVLGSGGHTAELIETIRRNFRGQANQHRRYVITSGDQGSMDKVLKLEKDIRDACPRAKAGTYDVFKIVRARRVHQSKLTAPLTCLLAAAHAIVALTREPAQRRAKEFGKEFLYPHVIVTNGPATGFIIGLVAYLLKMFYLVPTNRLKTVYIESWARTQTLSLTGKLFLKTGIANMFCVQHMTLAENIPGAEFVQVATRATPFG